MHSFRILNFENEIFIFTEIILYATFFLKKKILCCFK